jgi:hypothetical protein
VFVVAEAERLAGFEDVVVQREVFGAEGVAEWSLLGRGSDPVAGIVDGNSLHGFERDGGRQKAV